MKMAKCVATRDMEAIALADFGIEEPTITNLADVHGKSKEKLNFEILVLWRNKTSKNSKEVIIYCQINIFLFAISELYLIVNMFLIVIN